MNVATIVVVLLLLGITILVISKMVQSKRSGKSLHCGGDCSHCMSICGKKMQSK